MKRPEELHEGHSRGAKNSMPDEYFASEFPTITEYLVTSQWDDGSSRTPSTATIRVEQGVVKVCLNDHDQRRSLFAAGGTLTEALHNLDAALNVSPISWKSWPPDRKRK